MITDLHAAIENHWYGNNLDERFVAYREGSDAEGHQHLTLNDTDAGPGTPMPFAVYEVDAGSIVARMSGIGNLKTQIRDVGTGFTVHAKQANGRSAKKNASDMAEEVMKIFGGHYSVAPTKPTMERGTILIVQYQSDFPTREGDTNYSWTINYLVRIDTTVAVPA